MRKIIFYCSLLLAVLLTCQKQKTKEYTSVTLQKLDEVLAISDSVVFGWIRDIELTDSRIYLLDQEAKKVIETDLDFGLIKRYGSAGQGPNEMLSPLNLYAKNGVVNVYDGVNGKVLSFENGEIVNAFKHFIPAEVEFGMKEDNVIYSYQYSYDTLQIISKDLGNGSVDVLYEEQDPRYFQNPMVHVVNNNDFIALVIKGNIVEVRLVKYDGTLIQKLDEKDFEILNPWLNSLNLSQYQDQPDPNTLRGQIIFRDVCLTKGSLYLLPPVMVNNGKRELTIIKFNIDDSGKFSDPVKMVYGDENSFSLYSFAVLESKSLLVGYDKANGSLISYKLP